jgi:hypothetical protein
MKLRAFIAPFKGDAPPGSDWVQQLTWYLIDAIGEQRLEQDDSDIAARIWPEYAPHTISWNLGRLIVTENDQDAVWFCAALATVLGDGHCVNAFEHGT